MSTNEPALTRKQIREIQRTGAVPVQSEDALDALAAADVDEPAPTREVPPVPPAPPAPPAHLPRAAEPVIMGPPPGADSTVDLGASPLTRRQAREQDRIRTASVPVITPEVAAANAAPVIASAPVAPPLPPAPESLDDAAVADGAPVAPDAQRQSNPWAEPAPAVADGDADTDTDAASASPDADESTTEDVVEAEVVVTAPSDELFAPVVTDAPEHEDEPSAEVVSDGVSEGVAAPSPAPVATVGPQFGAELLSGDEVVAALPPSFDELIARNATSTGMTATPSALILSQSPTTPPLSGPVTSTGEIIVTGSYHLPAGLGSAGGDPRTTDGKEIDSVLIDGELPAASSPTPIAASAAISTVRGTGEIIRPPAPEKGSKLLFSLAITAGVLALALVGVLILAFVTGVF